METRRSFNPEKDEAAKDRKHELKEQASFEERQYTQVINAIEELKNGDSALYKEILNPDEFVFNEEISNKSSLVLSDRIQAAFIENEEVFLNADIWYRETYEAISALQDPDTRTNIEHIANLNGGFFSVLDVQTAMSLDQHVWNDDELAQEIKIILSGFPDAITRTAEKLDKKVNMENIVEIWPEELQELVASELTPTEGYMLHVDLHASLNSQVDYYAHRIVVSPHAQQFIIDNFSKFTPEAMSEISERRKMSQAEVYAALLSCFESWELEDVLEAIGEKKPVVVLENFRGYRSCSQSEPRLLKEIENQKASYIDFIFDDGAHASMAIKYTEVITAYCFQSSHPDFKKGTFYIPVGKTVKKAKDIGGAHHVTDLRVANTPKQIWAINRKSEYTAKEHEQILKGYEKYLDFGTDGLDSKYEDYEKYPKQQSMKRS